MTALEESLLLELLFLCVFCFKLLPGRCYWFNSWTKWKLSNLDYIILEFYSLFSTICCFILTLSLVFILALVSPFVALFRTFTVLKSDGVVLKAKMRTRALCLCLFYNTWVQHLRRGSGVICYLSVWSLIALLFAPFSSAWVTTGNLILVSYRIVVLYLYLVWVRQVWVRQSSQATRLSRYLCAITNLSTWLTLP